METIDKITAIDEIATGIADVTLELMEDSIDWQLADFDQDGDDYNDIHSEVMFCAIEKMRFEIEKNYYKKPANK